MGVHKIAKLNFTMIALLATSQLNQQAQKSSKKQALYLEYKSKRQMDLVEALCMQEWRELLQTWSWECATLFSILPAQSLQRASSHSINELDPEKQLKVKADFSQEK